MNSEHRSAGRHTCVAILLAVSVVAAMCVASTVWAVSGDAALGTRSYDDYESPGDCGGCHVLFYQQWKQAMMSQSYTHHWDEIEYFKLAVPHAEKDEVVAGVKAGCNGCHAPLAFLAGDIPPARPEAGSRANEGVSCDVCHTVTGFEGEVPFNFNFVSSPGDTKYGPRDPSEDAPHQSAKSEFLGTAEFCGTCHNEKDPYGIWVKSTHLEWKEGPYAAAGVVCQDCHMPAGPGVTVDDGPEYADARQHLFHGAHTAAKVRGTVELGVYPEADEAAPGSDVTVTISLFNQKAGHKFPTGSVEDRILWLHVEAIDANGKRIHLPVVPKGFDGEEYTIGSDELAYQDMSIALGDPDFKGVPRDGIPVGDRIFRMAYFDPQGRMTIQQWNTKSLGADYRLGPRETKLETYSLHVPDDASPGPMTISAVLNYQKLVKPVGDFLGVPEEETEVFVVNDASAQVQVMQ